MFLPVRRNEDGVCWAEAQVGKVGLLLIAFDTKQHDAFFGADLGELFGRLAVQEVAADVTLRQRAIDKKRICNSFWPHRGEDDFRLVVVPVASDIIHREVERRQPAHDWKEARKEHGALGAEPVRIRAPAPQ